jgi:hypothetical protein
MFEAHLDIFSVPQGFMHINCQKCIEDDVGNVKYIFTKKPTLKLFFWGENDPMIRFIHLIMP